MHCMIVKVSKPGFNIKMTGMLLIAVHRQCKSTKEMKQRRLTGYV